MWNVASMTAYIEYFVQIDTQVRSFCCVNYDWYKQIFSLLINYVTCWWVPVRFISVWRIRGSHWKFRCVMSTICKKMVKEVCPWIIISGVFVHNECMNLCVLNYVGQLWHGSHGHWSPGEVVKSFRITSRRGQVLKFGEIFWSSWKSSWIFSLAFGIVSFHW